MKIDRSGGNRGGPPLSDEATRSKAEREGCRWHKLGDCEGPLETVHVMGRKHDEATVASLDVGYLWPGYDLYVEPVRIVGGCRHHHRMYDRHELDLLHLLSLDEQLQAVRDAGSVESMRRRTAPTAYRKERAA